MPADLAVIIPARNEADRIGATVAAARQIHGISVIVVVDDGSADDTAEIAGQAGARVIRHQRGRGKAAAMESGAEAVRLLEAAGDPRSRPLHLLFLDGDLGDTASSAGPLAEPVRAGTADVTIAAFANRVRKGGFGIVVATSGAGTRRAIGWQPAQPLNGMRCLTRAAFQAALPLAPGWGAETAMTIDLARQGLRITEVEVPLSHRATGNDWRGQLHRLHQLADVTRALVARDPVVVSLRQRLRHPAGSRHR